MKKELSRNYSPLYYLVLVFMVIVSVETAGHLLFYIIKGYPRWDTETSLFAERKLVFDVQEYSDPVEDGRVYVLKKDSAGSYGFSKFSPDGQNYIFTSIDCAIDTHGFVEGHNRYYSDKANIVFIGDSVPFGWGTEGRISYPSQFSRLIEKAYPGEFGVMNAAVPGYHLFNAVERFRIEIAERFPVSLVIVQTIEPLSIIINYGGKYKKEMCWGVPEKDSLAVNYGRIKRLQETGLYRFSVLYGVAVDSYKLYLRSAYTWKEKRVRQDVLADEEAVRTITYEINSVLEELHALLGEKGIPLVLLPPNIPDYLFSNSKNSEKVSVADFVAAIYENFAASNQDVYFLDVRELFKNQNRKPHELFVDECCHLSEYGTALQAAWLFDGIQRLGLLSKN